MFDWPQEAAPANAGLALEDMTVRLLLSLVLGGVVAGIYVLTQRRSRSELVPFATTLVLLTVLIAMVTLVIGNSIARAFSLAGALAIIRFRTVVEDTRDTAFVIFAVVVGMGAGSGLLIIPLIGTPIVAVAALVLSYLGPSSAPTLSMEYSLAIRLSLGRDPTALFQEAFAQHLTQFRLKATTTARQGSALDLSYSVRLRRDEDAVALVSQLNQIEGVQNVELRQL